MVFYVKLLDGTRVGPFRTVGAAQKWCFDRYVDEFSLHTLYDPHVPCYLRREQGPDH
jgi:hypothetical protein